MVDSLFDNKSTIDSISYRYDWEEDDWRRQIYYKMIMPTLVEKVIRVIVYPSLCSILSGGNIIDNEEVQESIGEIYKVTDEAVNYMEKRAQTLE